MSSNKVGAGHHALPLSMWRRIGDTVHVAGHGAVDASGKFVSDQFEAQMRYTMDELKRTLESAGVGFAEVAMVRAYVQNPSDLPTYNKVFREYFAAPFPARTTIVSCLPPGLLFEIDCVAEAAG